VEIGNEKKKDRTGKDLDFAAEYPQGLIMSPSQTNEFTTALENDTSFLRRWECTDYSLLVSVYKDDAALDEQGTIDCGDLGRAKFCIIDYLQQFDLAKRRESTVKNMLRSDSSVQNPQFYRKRFLREICPSFKAVSTTTKEKNLAVGV